MQPLSSSLRILLIPIFLLLFAYPIEANTSHKSLNKIIEAYRNNDLNSLELSFSDFRTSHLSEDPKLLKIIHQVLVAEKYSKTLDQSNTQIELLYITACKAAKALNQHGLNIWVQTHIGFYYYRNGQLSKALPYFLFSSQSIDVDASNLIEPAEVLKRNAFFFGYIEDYKKAENYLTEALKHSHKDSKIYIEILNNLGMNYFRQNQLIKAEESYLSARKLALNNGQEILYAKTLGELAKICISRNDYIKAKTLYLEDIAISKKNNSDRNTMYAQVQLGKIYLEEGQLDSTYLHLQAAKNYVIAKPYLASTEFEINQLLVDWAVLNKDVKAELQFRRSADSLRAIIAKTDGQVVVDQLNIQAQKDKIKSQLESEKNKLEKASLVRNTWISISVLLFIIALLLLLIYRRKLKSQGLAFERNILLLQLEKIQSDNKLHETQTTLSSYQVYLSEKNEQLTKLEKEFKKLKSLPRINAKIKENNLQKLLDSHLMTKDNWLEFKKLFIAEQTDYYDYLMENFPGLTEANLRIILLQKMGLKNLETAQILGVTIEAVKKSKQRLKKRYEENYSEIFNDQ
ncbi:tetratricopeptide repeat protein [Flavobacterium sp. HSC-61S13]|uniref:tetratricopeptide repeat protein n=1 Tax=Flavobacterium sp. HSC-61S13 TaxID=2910963 RepID=UPI00209F01D7|nr:tetratricopeptide repeat protein [Flavobacterium sp. HSC-61S13]MCP1996393.1 tetratricopeptide (TPR) repeat protein [Flavobacterium sp. HSC-61S13]